ncbi:MAG: hypothetical protein [aquatic viral metagenome]
MSSGYPQEVVIIGSYNPQNVGEFYGYASALILTPDGKQWQGYIDITKEGTFAVYIQNMSIDTWLNNYNNSNQPISVTTTGSTTGNLTSGITFAIAPTGSQVSIGSLQWNPSNKKIDIVLDNLTSILTNPDPSTEPTCLQNYDYLAAIIYFITPSEDLAQQIWNATQYAITPIQEAAITFMGILVEGANGIGEPGYYYDGSNYIVPLIILINPQQLQQFISGGGQCIQYPNTEGYQTIFCYQGNNTWKISLLGITVNSNTTLTVAVAGA